MVNKSFAASLFIGSVTLAYWTDSFTTVVAFVSGGMALAALANGIASRLYTIAELLEKISNCSDSTVRVNNQPQLPK